MTICSTQALRMQLFHTTSACMHYEEEPLSLLHHKTDKGSTVHTCTL